MTQTLTFYQLDAFTAEVFRGNPAGVCPLEAWLSGELMQAIAAENNLSETAFFVRRGQDYDLRWFTPTTEVDLCGHATLASAYVISHYLEPDRRQMRFLSRSGPLEVSRAGELLTLDFPARPSEPFADAALVAAAVGRTTLAVEKAGMMLALLENEAAVRAAAPDLAKVAALPSDGLIITAPGESCDFVSRYFAPHAGIPEDPVTGSAHCVLAPFWSKRLDKAKMSARQVSARGGELEVEDKGARVLISGRVAPYLEGRIHV